MDKKNLTAIFKQFQLQNTKPTTELHYTSPFELLIAVVLSAQCTDARVNRVTKHLFAIANTPKALYELGEIRLKEIIHSIGFYNTKSKNIIRLCYQLLEEHHGKVPHHREALESLAGVGRKSANVILNTIFGENTIAVDTHIFRVANRIGLASGKTPLAIETQLSQNIPKRYLKDAHHWLVLHGRYICVARKPKCPECFLKKWCLYSHKTPLPESP